MNVWSRKQGMSKDISPMNKLTHSTHCTSLVTDILQNSYALWLSMLIPPLSFLPGILFIF